MWPGTFCIRKCSARLATTTNWSSGTRGTRVPHIKSTHTPRRSTVWHSTPIPSTFSPPEVLIRCVCAILCSGHLLSFNLMGKNPVFLSIASIVSFKLITRNILRVKHFKLLIFLKHWIMENSLCLDCRSVGPPQFALETPLVRVAQRWNLSGSYLFVFFLPILPKK